MDIMLVLFIGTIVAAVCLGVLLGRMSLRTLIEDRVRDAYRKGKDEGEVEKANLAVELGEQLSRVRESLQQTALAYESTVKVVHEKLSIPADLSRRMLGRDDKRLLEVEEVNLLESEERKSLPNAENPNNAQEQTTSQAAAEKTTIELKKELAVSDASVASCVEKKAVETAQNLQEEQTNEEVLEEDDAQEPHAINGKGGAYTLQ